MSAVEVRDLAKRYRNGVEALRGISFDAGSGSVFALLGPNGAGKTTAVRILSTLSAPTSGSARVAGHDVVRERRRVQENIGYVAQETTVDPEATGRENLILQGRVQRVSRGTLDDRVTRLLSSFGLTDAADRRVQDYSGGMKRKLDLAMGVVHRPRVLFLDEPTTGLDPEARRSVWRELTRLTREEELTVLLTTHYMEEADLLSGRVAILDAGRIVARGSPDELKNEIRGDRITVELEDGDRTEEAGGVLRELGTVVDAAMDPDSGLLHAHVTHGARAVPDLVAALERSGLAVAEVALSRPTLEDVYLEATGQTFEEAAEAADEDREDGGVRP